MLQTWCWEMACERQVYRLRNVFFSQIIRQDITWFDTNQSNDLTSKLFEYDAHLLLAVINYSYFK